MTEKIKLPFVYTVDVREYFKQYAEQYIESKKESVVEIIEEKYSKTLGAVAEHVTGYLPKII